MSSEARIADRFVLEQAIGTGGMGTVWRALDTRTGEPVAVIAAARRLADEVP